MSQAHLETPFMRSLAGSHKLLTYRSRFRRRPIRPVWSARSFTLGALLVVVGVAVPILLLGERSLLARAELATMIIAGLLWVALFVGLFRGVRLRRDEPPIERPKSGTSNNGVLDGVTDLGDLAGIADGLLGGLVAFVAVITFVFMLIYFLPAILDGLAYAIFTLVASIAWISRRALRQTFLYGPRCRGRWLASAGRAGLFTALYAGWLLAVLVVVRVMVAA